MLRLMLHAVLCNTGNISIPPCVWVRADACSRADGHHRQTSFLEQTNYEIMFSICSNTCFARIQHNRGDQRSFASRCPGVQHNRGDHQNFTAGVAGMQHNRGDHQSFACRIAGMQHTRSDYQSSAARWQWTLNGPPMDAQWTPQWTPNGRPCFTAYLL